MRILLVMSDNMTLKMTMIMPYHMMQVFCFRGKKTVSNRKASVCAAELGQGRPRGAVSVEE